MKFYYSYFLSLNINLFIASLKNLGVLSILFFFKEILKKKKVPSNCKLLHGLLV
jgi:hypothetical protein